MSGLDYYQVTRGEKRGGGASWKNPPSVVTGHRATLTVGTSQGDFMETRTLCGDQAIGQTLESGNKLETSSGTHHGETHNL
jgi:hypothetical protein